MSQASSARLPEVYRMEDYVLHRRFLMVFHSALFRERPHPITGQLRRVPLPPSYIMDKEGHSVSFPSGLCSFPAGSWSVTLWRVSVLFLLSMIGALHFSWLGMQPWAGRGENPADCSALCIL